MKLGQALIELIVGMGILAILLPALATALITSSSGKSQATNYQEATMLLKEELESLDVVRNSGWDNFAIDGTHHTVISGDTWELAPGSETVGIFTRSLIISSVQRLNGAIVTSGGVYDPSTKKVEAVISWSYPRNSQVSSTRYFTRYHDNFSETDSTKNEFDLGTKVSVATTEDAGGEVVLSGGGHGDWCQPNLTQWSFDLNHNASGTALYATASANFNHAYAVTGNNNASETFYDVNISATYPPIATNNGNLVGQKKAYGVYGDVNYAYIATDTRQKQGVIIRLSDHTEVAWLDIGNSSVNGRSIVISGNYAYLSGTDSKIYVFDISNKSGTKTAASSVTLTGVATKLVYISGYLYAALDSASNQLAIISVNGSTFGSPNYVTVNGQNGRDLFVNSIGTLAYLATATSSNQAELFVIDTQSRSVLASQDTQGMDPRGVAAVTNNKVIIVGSGGYEYQVFTYNDSNHTFTNCPNGAGFLDVDSGIQSLATVVTSDYAYSYLLTGDSASEFKIIEGGPTGQSANSGTYTSAIYNAGRSTAFNRIFWTADTNPPTTNIQFQVAVADPNPDCASASYSFVGPDGTNGTYFSTPGALPLNDNGGSYQNPGQCFKYQAYFSTQDISQSPTLYDVTWGFSP